MKSLEQKIIVRCKNCGWRIFDKVTMTTGVIELKCPNCHRVVEVDLSLRKGTVKYRLVKNDNRAKTPIIMLNDSTDLQKLEKTPSSVRKVSMPTFLCDELREYIGLLYEPTREQRLFKVSKSKLSNNFHLLSDEAGLKRITIHGLRHSHVSLLISKKYDIFEVSKRIGHKSVKTTQDIYGHLFDDVQKSIANDLDKLRRGE